MFTFHYIYLICEGDKRDEWELRMMVRFFQRANKIKNFQPCGLFASRISLFHDVHDEERSYFWLASDCLGTLSPAFV